MPLVPITIKAKGRSGPGLPTYGIVDSGASESAVPVEMAEALGIDQGKDLFTEPAITAGGEAEQHVYSPGLVGVVLGHKFDMEGLFMNTPFVLLGQTDFFSQFKVSFDYKAGLYGEFTLEPR